MSSGALAFDDENWVVRLLGVPDQRARRSFLRRNPQLLSTASVGELYQQVVRLARVDLNQAALAARALSLVAEGVGDDHSIGLSLRARGHVLYLTGKHEAAVEHYERALHLFRRLRNDTEIGRTCLSGLQSLIYLGQYTKALSWVRLARKIFRKHCDRLRLARLDNNTGNILYRQDHFHAALRLYTRAYQEFQHRGEPSDVAIALRNIAVCQISLNHFARALEVYDQARRYCSEHNMPLLVAECDYNIAYLYYLRGQYTVAMRLYEVAREHCERVGDRYHMALCDLDGSELYLEVNLLGKATELAERAFSIFQDLQMRYEAAKALTNLAIAATERGEKDRALKLLQKARQLFRREGNMVWAALTNFYEAVVFYRSGTFGKARGLCLSALRCFSGGFLPGKAALCKILVARLDLQAGNLAKAKSACLAALRQLHKAESPALDFRAYLTLGEIDETLGNFPAAERSYFKAHQKLEHLRTQLRAEEPKIKFVQDKLVIYEKLVQLCVARPNRARREAALSYIEHAKSRSLADLISFRAHGLPGSSKEANQTIERVRELREELNWTCKRMEVHDLEGSSQRSGRLRLREQARRLEDQLAKELSALSSIDEEYLNLQSARTTDLRQLSSMLPADTLLLDYYTANGVMYVAVLSRQGVDVAPLVPVAQIRQHLELLQLQLSKFRLDGGYVSTFSKLLRSATEEHLRSLYGDLLAPVRHQLDAQHLVIAPHDLLHYVPFHALLDGDQYVVDNFSVSYAPSASVYFLCSMKEAKNEGKSLVMGVPDVLAPNILDEAKVVAATLPNAELFVGQEATVDRLRRHGPSSRFVHIATHGIFREDNPMFSSIRMGDAHLHLFDLYELRLNAELVTLSGCGTGLNVVVAGDELLGLVRGLLYAGSEAALVTLWDVQDKSAAEFMKSLYKTLVTTSDKSLALKTAVQQLRQSYPDPYYWAPFVLVGKFHHT